MTISFKKSLLQQFVKKTKIFDNHISHWRLEEIREGKFEVDDTYSFDLIDKTKKECIDIAEFLVSEKFSGKSLTTLQNWINNLENPNDTIITSLQQFEKTMLAIIKNSKTKWLLHTNGDGMQVPIAIKDVKYKGGTRDDLPRVFINGTYITVDIDGRYGNEREIKKTKIDIYFSFYKEDISPIDEEQFNSLIGSYGSEDENEDEENDTAKAKKSTAKKPAKKDSYLLTKILSVKGLMLIDDNYIEKYSADIAKANEISKKIGKVYVSDAKGKIFPDMKNSNSFWRELSTETRKNKLVVDEVKDENIVRTSIGENGIGSFEIPELPYVLTYDITAFRYALVHVDNLTPYVYDDKIIDKLVLKDKTKRVLKSLIGTKNDFEDIISGKSGGVVVLSTGESGLGKTLTAEVCSELMEKPLYSVQSSQLGIDVKTIEENLSTILRRAEKWDAVLLIDEADSYIYERGQDILQNCIVGTFLRLMEYYNGILFLTSNRGDKIDDAIMSRVTLHIKYEYPTKEESVQLWNILCENFKLHIEPETISAIWNKYKPFSGRDIRNTLKDIKKIFSTEKSVKIDMIDDIAEYLPFAKEWDSSNTKKFS